VIRHTEVVSIRKPVAEVFDFVITDNYRNHPRWEDEVVEVRPLTTAPMGLGSRAVTVRRDWGKVSEATQECVAYEKNRLATFRVLDGPMGFEISFSFSPAPEGTRLQVDVAAQPRGSMRLLSPLLRLRMPRMSARLSNRMRELVEQERVQARSRA
jgi:hypothetical protein